MILKTDNSQTIRGIFHWCDRWCERCKHTGNCTLYNSSNPVQNENPDDFFKSLSAIFNTTIDILKEYAKEAGINFESLKNDDIKDEYDKKRYAIKNNEGLLLAKQYSKRVKSWLDSLKEKEPLGMEMRLQDLMLSDCFAVIQWYHYLIEVKFTRALMSQKEEKEEPQNPYDSLGNAKLLLVSIERNIGAWGYLYQKFREDEDEILDILVLLQKITGQAEMVFPSARGFIRSGLDE
jgi:hypothetical protein